MGYVTLQTLRHDLLYHADSDWYKVKVTVHFTIILDISGNK